MMAYYFFLNDTMLPVPPPKMAIKIDNKNRTLNLINEGEINVIKTPGLSEISFDVLLPNQYYPFANYDTKWEESLATDILGSSVNFKKANYFLDLFEKAKNSKIPLRLIVTRMTPRFELLFNTNLMVTLESYSVNEDAKDGTDLIVPLRFKQYRPYVTKELEVTTDKDGKKTATVKTARATDQKVPDKCKITKEQSVWEACKRASGGGLDWRSVMNLNELKSPVGVKEGAVLRFAGI